MMVDIQLVETAEKTPDGTPARAILVRNLTHRQIMMLSAVTTDLKKRVMMRESGVAVCKVEIFVGNGRNVLYLAHIVRTQWPKVMTEFKHLDFTDEDVELVKEYLAEMNLNIEPQTAPDRWNRISNNC